MSGERTNSVPARSRVLVLGGGGFYGRRVVEDLLQWTNFDVVVAERHPPDLWKNNTRIRKIRCDMRDSQGLLLLVSQCDLVIHCAGPFQELPLEPLRAALAHQKHYVDLSEDRDFHRRVLQFNERARVAGITVASGASVVPGLQVLLVQRLRANMEIIESVRTFAAPDTRRHRGPAMFHTMLLGAGRPFFLPRAGVQAAVLGWSEPEWVEFPPPVGRRLVFLVLEMAELDILPSLFGAESVEFKAGCEFPLLNRTLGLLAAIRARAGHPKLEQWTAMVRAFSWIIGRVGREEGGMIVQITGNRSGQPISRGIALTATVDGGRIPSILASVVASEILMGRLTQRGVVSPEKWLDPNRMIDSLRDRQLVFWVREGGQPWEIYGQGNDVLDV